MFFFCSCSSTLYYDKICAKLKQAIDALYINKLNNQNLGYNVRHMLS
jgi:hypothetical protein